MADPAPPAGRRGPGRRAGPQPADEGADRPAGRTAAALRRSLAGTDPRALDPAQAGLALGRLIRPGRNAARGSTVYASWEDTVLSFMAPRSGKTTSHAIPFVLSAPGAVIATSNKSDLWAATASIRAAACGNVWLFDPQHVTHQPQAWWWNLLHGLRTVEEAHRLAGHFVLTVADEHRREIWGRAAQDLLAAPVPRRGELRPQPVRRRRMAERARRAHTHRATRRSRVHRHGRVAARRHHITGRAHQGVTAEDEPGEGGQAAQPLRQRRQLVALEVELGEGGQAAQRFRQRRQVKFIQAQCALTGTDRLTDATLS